MPTTSKHAQKAARGPGAAEHLRSPEFGLWRLGGYIGFEGFEGEIGLGLLQGFVQTLMMLGLAC